MVQRLALALVDGDRPGQAEGQLREAADHLMAQSSTLHDRPGDVPGVRPGLLATAVGQRDGDHRLIVVVAHCGDASDRAVDPPRPVMGTLTVGGLGVGEHHHLGTHCEGDDLVGRGVEARGVSGDGGPVAVLPAAETRELAVVAGRGDAVGGGQGEPELVDRRLEPGVGALVQLGARSGQQPAVAHGVEQVHQPCVADLAEHGGELHGGEVVAAVGVRREEPGRLVGG